MSVADGRDEAAARKCLEKLAEPQRQQVQTYRTDMAQAFHNPCRELLPNARAVVDHFCVAKLFNEVIDGQRKKIARRYKAKLSKDQRKELRSLMWEFRREPQELSQEDKHKLEALFGILSPLRTLYEFRLRFQKIFDTAKDRRKAYRALVGLFVDMLDFSTEFDGFIKTFEQWQEEILNYFEARQASGPVEGINNKTRVILKRACGLKSVDSLWTRLILDLDRAQDVVKYTIGQIQDLVAGFRASLTCT
jgi:transposase